MFVHETCCTNVISDLFDVWGWELPLPAMAERTVLQMDTSLQSSFSKFIIFFKDLFHQ